MIAATTQRSRQAALAAMSDDEGLDVLVVGGGVTGAGVALDAATRGLRTGIVEMQDWASGTSSRSSKLIHGGMRYLYNLDFALVQEALRERGLLLSTIAPHLVRPQPFLWPLKIPVVERTYSALGVGLYDAMSAVGNLTLPGDKEGAGVPPQKHYGRKGALELFPDLRSDQLTGAIRFFDARVDDARLVLGLVRTAVSYGALAATRAQVTEITKDAVGRVVGAVVTDLETGRARQVRAKHVISCTGVWTEETESLASSTGSLEVLASKGVHLVIPKDRIKGSTGLFLRTEKSVLFVIPWQHYWVIGTTDTPWEGPLRHPITTRADIDYVLEQANKVLTSQLTTDDILGTWAGLRPLLQPSGGAESSAKVSREHTVAEVAPGMVSIAGGKLTTYRVMAEDAVDFALGSTAARRWPSITERIPLVGAVGLEAAGRYLARVAPGYGWDADRIEHLLSRYGSEVGTLIDLIEEDPRLAEPLPSAPAYLGVEVAFAVRYEGSLHLEDVLLHRLRIDHEARDRGLSAVEDVLAIAVPLLGWDEDRQQAEVDAYRARLAGIRAGEAEWSDAEAIAERSRAEDLIPIRPLRRAHRI
ncbi:glycerol-3-phosphate dehydrogenase/oxidase [Auraticoccus monumenti]|uniref:Glycerol-3-phosphate dehydrogenase n=1 Tax=Auraticoccus monumenti TaxID=675864 RepID=A0A1G6S1I8_9ACTN|nr:glycerol-3-phosphate dehydrogenase/oxidase [Auraticoccus monumenti]SDD10709.1 glycerol-3-phosphate dehydrogenase [Auraticoccus monumenti]